MNSDRRPEPPAPSAPRPSAQPPASSASSASVAAPVPAAPRPAGDRPDAARLALLAGILLVGLNLRPLFSSTSVVLPEILAGTGMSGFTGGLLTTLPVLVLGLFAPLSTTLAAAWTLERTVLAVIVLIALASALRGLGSPSALFIAALLGGAGIAVGNVLLPALIKRDFPGRVRFLTGLYTMALCSGAALGAGLTVPMANVLGGDWAGALALWAMPAIVALLVWLPQAARAGAAAAGPRPTLRGLARDRLAWSVTLFMGLQSLLAYAVMGWLAPVLRWRGLDAVHAGSMTSVSLLTQAGAALLTPALIAGRARQSGINAGAGALALVALLGVLFGPVPMLWPVTVALGVAQGALFALGLTMILLRSPDARTAASLSAMSQGVGYTLAACGPLMIGAIRDATGGFAGAALPYLVVGIGVCVFGWQAGAPAFVRAGNGPVANRSDDSPPSAGPT